MDVNEFWGLIARSNQRQFDSEERAEWLTDRLAELPAGEIAEFQLHLDRVRAPLDSYALWGAAYVICGGASDDAFWYFQLWVIGQGREVYERVLADPDALAAVGAIRLMADEDEEDDEVFPEWEALDYVAEDAYEESTGGDLFEMLPGSGYETRGTPDPSGEQFDLEDDGEISRRYPRLAELFPSLEFDYAE